MGEYNDAEERTPWVRAGLHAAVVGAVACGPGDSGGSGKGLGPDGKDAASGQPCRNDYCADTDLCQDVHARSASSSVSLRARIPRVTAPADVEVTTTHLAGALSGGGIASPDELMLPALSANTLVAILPENAAVQTTSCSGTRPALPSRRSSRRSYEARSCCADGSRPVCSFGSRLRDLEAG